MRANSSNKQEGDLVAPEGEGRTLASTCLVQKNVIHHYPACPVNMLLRMVSVKTRQRRKTLLTVFKCCVRSLLEQEQLQAHAFFVNLFGFLILKAGSFWMFGS